MTATHKAAKIIFHGTRIEAVLHRCKPALKKITKLMLAAFSPH
jgi:hypothetical protein